MGSETKEQITNAFSSAAEQAQKQVAMVGERVKTKARDIAEQQKAAGADQIGGVTNATVAAAYELQRQMPLAAEYIDDVAKQHDKAKDVVDTGLKQAEAQFEQTSSLPDTRKQVLCRGRSRTPQKSQSSSTNERC